MRKNIAGQIVGAQMIDTDGAAFTGAVTVYVTGDNGAQAIGTVGAGAAAHKGNGVHNYAPAQAETNFDHVEFTFIGAGAIPQTLVYEPVGFDPADAVRLGLAALPGAAADAAGGLPVSDAGGLDLDTLLGGVTTLLARLTAARGGYLDFLNIGGPVASSAEATAIQNNTRVVRVVPAIIERPDAGTQDYRIELFLYDDTGAMEAPDAAPTIALVDQAGTDLSGRLDDTAMALVETGRYRAVYTADAGHDLDQLVWTFSVIEGAATRTYGNASLIVDTSAVDFTAADRTKLDTLHDTRLTAARAGYLDALNGHTPQTGDSYARLGAPAGASIAADVAAVLTAVGTRLAASGYTAPDDADVVDAIALAVLTRDWDSITGEAGRSALNALRLLRNKHTVAAGTLTVTKEDDATAAWTAAVTADAGAEPITGVDPA